MGKCYNQLTRNDRQTIEKMLNTKKFTKNEIAEVIGCTRWTIYREIKKGMVDGMVDSKTTYRLISKYSSDKGDITARNNKKLQGAKLKSINDIKYLEFISKKIVEDRYSPNAICMFIKKNKIKFNTNLSYVSIYSYVKRGYINNVDMSVLPYEKIYKRKYEHLQKRASFGKSIEKRPFNILSRQEFGHWEMDSVEGAKGKSEKALLVLTERKTRKELIFKYNKTTEGTVKIIDYLEKVLKEKFNKIFIDITMDNGSEFANSDDIMKSKIYKNKIRTQVYYCHPSAPTERGTNENLNKMIRKYLPKGYNFDNETLDYIYYIQEEINNYPRKLFSNDSANERFLQEIKNLNIKKEDVKILF